MAERIAVEPDLRRFAHLFRVVARHLSACADELESGDVPPCVDDVLGDDGEPDNGKDKP